MMIGRVLLLVLGSYFSLVSFCLGANFLVTNVAEFQTALSTAESNGEDDTITVRAGTYNLTGMLHYNADDGDGSLTVVAEDLNNRPVLDGQGNTLLMNIDNDSNGDHQGDDGDAITIRGLVFQNGSGSNGYGGALAIRIGAADVHIEGCIFQNNHADHEGGGFWVYSDGGTASLFVINNQFSSDSAAERGGGFNFFTRSGSLTVSNNSFDSNQVTSAQNGYGGGGFSAISVLNAITVSNNSFQNN